MLHVAARLALAPVLYAQARRLRRTVPELPEPAGERRGLVAGNEPELRLLVAGDSSAAGVGARTQDQAFARPLAAALASLSGRAVRWQLVAQLGLTSRGLLRYLQANEVQPADVAVVVCGVNDITKSVPLAEALRQRGSIARWLRDHRGVRHVFFPAVPEMDAFPAVPSPLGWYVGLLSRRNNRAQAHWAPRAGVTHVAMDSIARPELFCEDGFHPSPALYGIVAQRLAERIAAAVAPSADD